MQLAHKFDTGRLPKTRLRSDAQISHARKICWAVCRRSTKMMAALFVAGDHGLGAVFPIVFCRKSGFVFSCWQTVA
jgi:hypothetical protein